jgi:hydroxymethylpyrimidine/phosphomethylpyrimidine kinase
LAGVPVVVDPVIVATSGDVLLADDAIDAVRTRLLPCAAVITPNLREAARLLETPAATSIADMEDQARRLLAFGAKAVLLKGGHGEGPEAIDVLPTSETTRHFRAPRIDTHNTHGTGFAATSSLLGRTPASESLLALTSIMNHILCLLIVSGSELGSTYTSNEAPRNRHVE